MAKRKGIPWGPSNPLYRWQHRKANKVVKRKANTVTNMPRKRRSYRGKARRWFHRRDKRIPIVPVIAIASTVVTPCPSGRTILNDLTSGNWEALLYDAREKYACIDNTGAFHFEDVIKTYGPIVAAVLVSKFAGKFVNPTISKIPFIGKYVRL